MPDILAEAPLSVLSGKPVEAIAGDKNEPQLDERQAGGGACRCDASASRRAPRARAPLAQSEAPGKTAEAKPTHSKTTRAKASTKAASVKSRRSAPLDIAMPKGARKAKMPDFVEPCLATAATAPPAGENFVHEIKFDGYRLQPALDEGRVVIRTRRGLDWTARFPTIAEAVAALPVKSAIFDGEAVVEDRGGISDFAKLQDALKSGRQRQHRLLCVRSALSRRL